MVGVEFRRSLFILRFQITSYTTCVKLRNNGRKKALTTPNENVNQPVKRREISYHLIKIFPTTYTFTKSTETSQNKSGQDERLIITGG